MATEADNPKDILTCTVCNGDFNIVTEGGSQGYIGMLPVQFCPTCRCGIFDYVEQSMLPVECPHCGELIGDE